MQNSKQNIRKSDPTVYRNNIHYNQMGFISGFQG